MATATVRLSRTHPHPHRYSIPRIVLLVTWTAALRKAYSPHRPKVTQHSRNNAPADAQTSPQIREPRTGGTPGREAADRTQTTEASRSALQLSIRSSGGRRLFSPGATPIPVWCHTIASVSASPQSPVELTPTDAMIRRSGRARARACSPRRSRPRSRCARYGP